LTDDEVLVFFEDHVVPTVNRWVIALASMFPAILWIIRLAMQDARKTNPWPMFVGLVVTLLMGVGGMAVALFAFRRRPEEERSAGFLPEGWPSEQDREHLVVAERVGLTGEMRRVMVDPHKGRIYFENEHTPRLFLARAQKYFECSIGDVLCAKEVKVRNGSYLLILTSTGKSSFSSFNGYNKVRDALRRLGVPPVGGPELESGRTMLLGMYYGLLGGIVAASTTSAGMSDFDFYGRILGGAVLGVGLLLLVIWAGQKLLGLRLTLAMTGLLLGGGPGFLGYVLDKTFIGDFLRIMLGNDAPRFVWVGAAILGAAGGFWIGLMIQRGRELDSNQILQEARTNS
jgi:hypothetical protein